MDEASEGDGAEGGKWECDVGDIDSAAGNVNDDDDIAEELANMGDERCNAVRLRMNAVMPDADVDLEEPDIVFNVLE
jgi:hypothetical protein